MLLLVDRSFSATGDGLGALEGCIDFAELVGESYDIRTCNLQDVKAANLNDVQFDASHILDAYNHCLVENDDRMIILTSLDLTAHTESGWLNFIFGLSRNGTACIVSTYRFSATPAQSDLIRQANRLIAMHELGHVWGLVPDYSPSADRRGGIYRGHCTRRCTMQQVVSIHQATLHAAELGDDSFCTNCLNHLASSHL